MALDKLRPGPALQQPAGRSAVANASPRPSHPTPVPQDSAVSTAAFETLLRIESEARSVSSINELCHLVANETRKLTRARQIFVLETGARGSPRVVTVSSLGLADQQSELARSIEGLVAQLNRTAAASKDGAATLSDVPGERPSLPQSYPFQELLWLPFKRRSGEVFAGMLMVREQPWTPDDLIVAKRLALAYAHAWRELTSVPRFVAKQWPWKRIAYAAGAISIAALFVPVSLTALAPVEVVPNSPYVVAAPIDGVIEEVLVDPSAPVQSGQILLRFSDTVLRNRAEAAEREVVVAEAQLKKAAQSAFDDAQGRHELGIAEAELALKKAERDFARELLQKTVLAAPRNGIAVYPDRKELTGKPVATGERIMEIASPADVELRVDLAVNDAMALEQESAVKVFLDVEPLSPRWAKVVRSDFRARPADHGTMTFKTVAKLDAGDREPPRLGLRGTAQVYGPRVPLGIYLFRRPIAALRQSLGL